MPCRILQHHHQVSQMENNVAASNIIIMEVFVDKTIRYIYNSKYLGEKRMQVVVVVVVSSDLGAREEGGDSFIPRPGGI